MDINEIKVEDITLRIRMTYTEILELGFTPVSDDFAETEPGALASLSNFKTPGDCYVTLGFIADEGKKVSEGTLYLVRLGGSEITEKPASGSVDSIQYDSSSIEDIIAAFGDPYRIDDVKYDGEYKLKLQYNMEEHSMYINITIDPDTGKLLALGIEGYTD
jgi:hypothetical protein